MKNRKTLLHSIDLKNSSILLTVFIFLVFLPNDVSSQIQKKIINGQEFEILTITNDDEQIESINVYRNNKKLLNHTLFKFDGDCSNENIELGDFKIEDSSINFYSYWASGDRMGKYIFPYGFRKQVYYVNKNGIVQLKSSKLYVETHVDGAWEHKGMKFVKSAPNSEVELELMNDYVSKAEKMYLGNFVFGEQKDLLENEVRNILKLAIVENTKYWEETYGENCNK